MPKKLHLTGTNADGTQAHIIMLVPPEFQSVTSEISGEILEFAITEIPGSDLDKDNLFKVIRMWLDAGKIIEAIKHLRMYTLYQTGEKMGLKDAKDYVEKYKRDNGYYL